MEGKEMTKRKIYHKQIYGSTREKETLGKGEEVIWNVSYMKVTCQSEGLKSGLRSDCRGFWIPN